MCIRDSHTVEQLTEVFSPARHNAIVVFYDCVAIFGLRWMNCVMKGTVDGVRSFIELLRIIYIGKSLNVLCLLDPPAVLYATEIPLCLAE